MKHLKGYEHFKESRKVTEELETVNEEIFGKLFGGLKKLFQKAKERINKTKGGKEIEAVYQKYLKMINDQLTKAANVQLNLMAASTGEANPQVLKDAAAGAPAAPGAPGAPAEGAKKESFNYKGEKIFEADDTNAKLAADTLKKKGAIMDQIVAKMKDLAKKEMQAVLTKFGGAAKNPQLNIILQTKLDQFDMDYLNAKINYLDQAGDKTMVAQISKQRDAVAKKIETATANFDKAVPVTYEEGDEVIYLLKGKKPEDYKKDKKPEDQKDVVGIHKIAKIEGDKFTLEDEEGKPTIVKTGAEIMGKVGGEEGEGGNELGEIKAGDTVVYKREKFDEEEWKKLTDEEKQKPEEGKMKELQDQEKIGIKKISKVEGDKISFEDADFTKEKGDILSKTEGEKAEGQEELVKKLGEIKSKKPEDIKKVSSYVDFISDEANKDKVAEIEKIIGEAEGGE